MELGTLRHNDRGGQTGCKVYAPYMCPTILADLGGYGLMTIIKVGDMDNSDGTFECCNRVYSQEGLEPTLPTNAGGDHIPKVICRSGRVESRYRIRKLTPRETWRLMGFDDADYDKASSVNSNTQLYKQAGNSIVKQVLMAIFSKMM